jgi:hypothetical protein
VVNGQVSTARPCEWIIGHEQGHGRFPGLSAYDACSPRLRASDSLAGLERYLPHEHVDTHEPSDLGATVIACSTGVGSEPTSSTWIHHGSSSRVGRSTRIPF